MSPVTASVQLRSAFFKGELVTRFPSEELLEGHVASQRPTSGWEEVLRPVHPHLGNRVGGIWIAHSQSGIWCAVGLTIAAVFSTAALLQTVSFIDGLVKIDRWKLGSEQKLRELEQRDGDLFAQGKSFEEIRERYQRKSLDPLSQRCSDQYSVAPATTKARIAKINAPKAN